MGSSVSNVGIVNNVSIINNVTVVSNYLKKKNEYGPRRRGL